MTDSWATFWGWVLGASLIIFAVISVIVTIGGFRDIRSLLAKAGENEENDIEGDEECTGSSRRPPPSPCS